LISLVGAGFKPAPTKPLPAKSGAEPDTTKKKRK